MLDNVFSLLLDDFGSAGYRLCINSNHYFYLIDYLLKTIQHIACGFGTILRNEWNNCLEYVIKLTEVDPVVILKYENQLEKDISLDKLNIFSNYVNNYLTIMEDLLCIVQKISAGIALISVENIDDSYLEFRIDFPLTELTVILLCELHLQQDCKTETVSNDKQIDNIENSIIKEEFINNSKKTYINVKKEISEFTVSDCCQASLTEGEENRWLYLKSISALTKEKSNGNVSYSFNVVSNVMPVIERISINSSFCNETEMHCALFPQKIGSVNYGNKNEMDILTKTTNRNCRINLHHNTENNINAKQNNGFLADFSNVQQDGFENDSYLAKGIKENNYEERNGITDQSSLSENGSCLDFCCNPSVYNADQTYSSNTEVVDMEIDDGRDLPSKFQKIIFDYSKARKLFKCKYCDKTFDSLWDTNKHEKMHMCSYCYKTFESSSLRSKHEKSHMEENIYHCYYCEKTFASKAGKRLHEKNHLRKTIKNC